MRHRYPLAVAILLILSVILFGIWFGIADAQNTQMVELRELTIYQAKRIKFLEETLAIRQAQLRQVLQVVVTHGDTSLVSKLRDAGLVQTAPAQ